MSKVVTTGISAEEKTLREMRKEAKKLRRSFSSFVVEMFFFWREKHDDKSDSKPNNS